MGGVDIGGGNKQSYMDQGGLWGRGRDGPDTIGDLDQLGNESRTHLT